MNNVDKILGQSSEFSQFLSVVRHFTEPRIFTSMAARKNALSAMKNYEKRHVMPKHVASWMYDILHTDPDDEASHTELVDGLGWCVIEAIQRGDVTLDPSTVLLAGHNPLVGGLPLHILNPSMRPHIEAVATALRTNVKYVLDRALDVFEANLEQ